MNWRAIDLNLLVVFDAIMQTKSATLAAARLNMTQSTVSHALTRLRSALQDELFIRTPNGMKPTPHAKRIAGPVSAALEMLSTTLERVGTFDPKTSQRRFFISADNSAALSLSVPLAAAVAADAPGIEISILPSGTLDNEDCLKRGEVDLAVGGFAPPAKHFSSRKLFEHGFAALVRCGHPAARNGVLSLEELGSYDHLVLSSTREETGFVDKVLAAKGLRRRVAFNSPLLTAPVMLEQSDMIAIMGEHGAKAFVRSAPLKLLHLPFDTPQLITQMLWHRRNDETPAHRWLRSVVFQVAKAL